MRIEVKLPDLGEGAGKEATVSFWYLEVGAQVKKDEDLVEMVTDKATFNVPCPASGTIQEILVTEGDKVQVGSVMAVLEG
jgi:pyruvate/2-oxoglutarate dehydrogenase complex dihydrolipoamide acyltransferase (E2) component